MSDIEGKVAREAMGECGQRASFNPFGVGRSYQRSSCWLRDSPATFNTQPSTLNFCRFILLNSYLPSGRVSNCANKNKNKHVSGKLLRGWQLPHSCATLNEAE